MKTNNEEIKKDKFKLEEELNVELAKFNARNNRIMQKLQGINLNKDINILEEAIDIYKNFNEAAEKFLYK